MKTYKHLFEELVTTENISRAIWRASHGKQKRRDVQFVLQNRIYYVRAIQYMLRHQLWQPRMHDAEEINDGVLLKKRIIVKPDFVYEQILHHALVQVLKPLFVRSMYAHSCGSVPKRGGVYGKRHLSKWIHRHPAHAKYCAKGDIRHFFQSVSMERIKEKLARKIKDKRFLWVLFQAISNCWARYKGEIIYMGLCIGYYTSQWLANWFLQDMDYFVKQRLFVRCYYRYVDDFVMVDNNKRKLHNAICAVRAWLVRVGLELKKNWQVFKVATLPPKENGVRILPIIGRAIDFMGFVFYRNKTVLRRNIFYRACNKARRVTTALAPNWYISTQLLCYLGWFKHSDTFNALKERITNLVDVAGLKKLVSAHQLKLNKEALAVC